MITIADAAAAKIQGAYPGRDAGEITPCVCASWVVAVLVCGTRWVFEEEQNPNDKVFVSNGVKVFIDLKSALYLAGAEVDYIDGLMQSGFKITNPNAKTTCGCGQSFH